MFGTDYTAHWIPDGIGSIILGGTHIDITNYYIAFGVNGGLLSLLLVIRIVYLSLRNTVSFSIANPFNYCTNDLFLVWCAGAAMFAYGISGISIAYFDQSVNLFWLSVALLCALIQDKPRDHQSNTASPRSKSIPIGTRNMQPEPNLIVSNQ